jgi:hypothetical protein
MKKVNNEKKNYFSIKILDYYNDEFIDFHCPNKDIFQ